MALPEQRIQIPTTGFRGMRYVTRAEAWDHDYLYYARDAFPTEDGRYESRAIETATSVATALVPQAFATLKTAAGATLQICIASGELYQLQTSQAWTKVISTANLTTASITLSATAHVFAVPFSTVLIVTDGTNTPFQWDGTNGGGLTKLTNAPVAFGPPTVYYAKVFFVKNANRDTIVWSNEGDATAGYEAGTANQVWQLRQSGTGPIYRLLGTNSALYYFRRDSIGSIRGAVGSDFTSAGTHAEISQTVGTIAPYSVVLHRGYIWFLDALARPWRFPEGGNPSPVWEQIDAYFPGPDAQQQGRARAFVETDVSACMVGLLPYHNAVVFGFQSQGASSLRDFWAFHEDRGDALCDYKAMDGTTAVTPLLMGTGTLLSVTGGGENAGLMLAYSSGTALRVSFGAADPLNLYPSQNLPRFTLGPITGETEYSRWREIAATFELGAQAAANSVAVSASLTSALAIGALDAPLPAVSAIAPTGAAASAASEARRVWGLKRWSRWLQVAFDLSATAKATIALARVEAVAVPDPAHPRRTV